MSPRRVFNLTLASLTLTHLVIFQSPDSRVRQAVGGGDCDDREFALSGVGDADEAVDGGGGDEVAVVVADCDVFDEFAVIVGGVPVVEV